MSKDLIIISDLIDKQERYVINWPQVNADKLAIFLKVYSKGKSTKTQACAIAGFSTRTLQYIQRLAQIMLAHCEDNNIDYKKTDCFYLINAFLLIEEARTKAAERLVEVIHKQAEDGNFNAAKYLLGKIDPEWIEVNNQPSVNVSVSDKGVAINLVDFNSVIDSAGMAQEQLMNLTREK